MLMHIYGLGLNYYAGNVFKFLIRSGAHKLFRRFLNFSQFLTAISQKLWQHLAKEMGSL